MSFANLQQKKWFGQFFNFLKTLSIKKKNIFFWVNDKGETNDGIIESSFIVRRHVVILSEYSGNTNEKEHSSFNVNLLKNDLTYENWMIYKRKRLTFPDKKKSFIQQT